MLLQAWLRLIVGRTALAAALAAVLLPASAQVVNADAQAKVAVGMSMAEVQAQIGPPRGKRHVGPTKHDFWRWRSTNPEDFFEVDFGPDGRVAGKSVVWVPPY